LAVVTLRAGTLPDPGPAWPHRWHFRMGRVRPRIDGHFIQKRMLRKGSEVKARGAVVSVDAGGSISHALKQRQGGNLSSKALSDRYEQISKKPGREQTGIQMKLAPVACKLQVP